MPVNPDPPVAAVLDPLAALSPALERLPRAVWTLPQATFCLALDRRETKGDNRQGRLLQDGSWCPFILQEACRFTCLTHQVCYSHRSQVRKTVVTPSSLTRLQTGTPWRQSVTRLRAEMIVCEKARPDDEGRRIFSASGMAGNAQYCTEISGVGRVA